MRSAKTDILCFLEIRLVVSVFANRIFTSIFILYLQRFLL